ncbi:MAG TPA: FG-GAP repeat protein [Candidatus Sulfotelmatobacter sp.]|nr:FG-GAP repeat protein [Candidatus Sulfotelmatobacter sp.]
MKSNCAATRWLLTSASVLLLSSSLLSQTPRSPWRISGLESLNSYIQDNFAASVAISEDQRTIVVGAPGWGTEGEAYVFVEPPGGWTSTTQYVAKLTHGIPQNSDAFGSAVAINGNTIVIGAPYVRRNKGPFGAVYVFVEPKTGWATTSHYHAELSPPTDQGVEGTFGSSVAFDGETVVVGGALNNLGQGLALVFNKPESGWSSTHSSSQLIASDGSPSDAFGSSVAVDHDTIVVGAIQDFAARQGEAYVFAKPGDGWQSSTETARLTASDGQPWDMFGASTSVVRDTIVIGALRLAGSTGAAYVFTRPSGGWETTTETAELTPSDGFQQDFFGYAVALWKNKLMVGAPNVSKLYAFVKPEQGWTTTSSFSSEWQRGGRSLAAAGETLVTGGIASTSDWLSSPGAAFVIRRN